MNQFQLEEKEVKTSREEGVESRVQRFHQGTAPSAGGYGFAPPWLEDGGGSSDSLLLAVGNATGDVPFAAMFKIKC